MGQSIKHPPQTPMNKDQSKRECSIPGKVQKATTSAINEFLHSTHEKNKSTMNRYKNLTLPYKLALAFAVVVSLVAALGLLGLRALSNVNDNSQNLYQVQLLPSLELAKMRGTIHQI